MGEVYGLAALALAFAGVGWLVIMKVVPKQTPEPNEGGTWRRVQETVATRDGSFVRVLLVREHEGRVTGTLPIRDVRSEDPDWNDKYMDAIAEADLRLAALESAERH